MPGKKLRRPVILWVEQKKLTDGEKTKEVPMLGLSKAVLRNGKCMLQRQIPDPPTVKLTG